ncbi:MAG TPA: tannase/feruloyl esterase family alpha/beta hydrolase [Chryseolinea sp.]
MKTLTTLTFSLLLSFSFNAICQSPCHPCEKLKDLKLPDVTIVSAESKEKDSLIVPEPWLSAAIITKPFCRVIGKISTEINFEILMPQQWNERFLMSGGGGFVGAIHNGFRESVNDGYSTAGTDTGHSGMPFTAEWAINNMERQINFGRLAVHRTTVVSKAIINAYYCKEPTYSYFLGCSRGGGQAMVEAQFYPQDFDGIVAGAPAYSWPAIGAKFIQISQKNYPDPKSMSPVLTSDNLKLLGEYSMKQCDKLDGLVDRIINDPRDCKFDLSTLPLCANNKAGAACFTKEQLGVLKAVYEPLVVNGKVIYPGFPVGLEADMEWDSWIAGTRQPSLSFQIGTGMYKYLVFNDDTWDYSRYSFSNYVKDTRFAASFLDATQTDYSEFKKNNGKMIIYHGWNDPSISAYSTIEHYEAAMQRDKDLPANVRLYLLPGVLHCGGGTGCDNVDWLGVIQAWVEENKSPERIVSSKLSQGKVIATRPLYPYPKVTVYSGSGDASQEKNYKVK